MDRLKIKVFIYDNVKNEEIKEEWHKLRFFYKKTIFSLFPPLSQMAERIIRYRQSYLLAIQYYIKKQLLHNINLFDKVDIDGCTWTIEDKTIVVITCEKNEEHKINIVIMGNNTFKSIPKKHKPLLIE